MKKIFALLGVVAIVSLSACKKDDPQPEPAGGGTSNPPVVTASTEGIYAPDAKVQTIKEDGITVEEWSWENGKLTTVTPYEDGAAATADARLYAYDGHNRITSIADGEMEMTFAYSGDKLQSFTLKNEGETMMTSTVSARANDKISKLDVAMSEGAISGMLGEMVGNISDDAVSNVVSTVDLTWTGDNVTRTITSFGATVTMTMSQLAEMLNLTSLVAQYPTIQTILNLYGSRPMDLVISVADTANYTYDGKNNPFCGFLFGLEEFSLLSKENVVSFTSNGTMTMELPAELMTLLAAVPGLSQTMSYPVPSESENYTYQYNAAGFPVSKNNGEKTVEYIYVQ